VIRRARIRWALIALAVVAFALLVSAEGVWREVLGALFPDYRTVVHPRGTLVDFTLEHLALVGVSSALTIAVGVPLGVWVTRRSGREFRPLVSAGVDLGQTFPPVAVLALAMPVLGFGFWPTIVALFLYGLFPVVSGTIAGIESVPRAVIEAAVGMGMNRWQVLVRVELPLAARVIMAGVRTSVAINIGTATVGAAIGTGGLGVPIIGGLAVQNMAYVLQGAVPAALLAVLADALLAQAEEGLSVATG
jgi:ABC-type proline/glycine betaine transport systems, permease component